MGLLTAVHIGNALDHEAQTPPDENTDLKCDKDYLDRLGVTNQIPEWRQLCKELAERNSVVKDKILLVDDDAMVLAGLKRQLRNQFRIETALSGEEALKMIEENGPYAVVVSDYHDAGYEWH